MARASFITKSSVLSSLASFFGTSEIFKQFLRLYCSALSAASSSFITHCFSSLFSFSRAPIFKFNPSSIPATIELIKSATCDGKDCCMIPVTWGWKVSFINVAICCKWVSSRMSWVDVSLKIHPLIPLDQYLQPSY